MTHPVSNYTFGEGGPTPKSERAQVLESAAPKIVDERKYYGAAVTDFRAIKKRMNELI